MLLLLNKMTHTLDHFKVGKLLGDGVSCVTKEGTQPDGTKVALKLIKAEYVKSFRREIKMLQNLKHPSLCNIISFNENGFLAHKDGRKQKQIYIAQELITGGEIFDFLAHSGAFSERICRFYFKQILMGLHYLHSNDITHRDLKPENILLDAEYNAKIIDFGYAAHITGDEGSGFNKSYVGTEAYNAPEVS